jgi:hypothetical protein
MTVERLTCTGGWWGVELHVDGRCFAYVGLCETEEEAVRRGTLIAKRWNAIEDSAERIRVHRHGATHEQALDAVSDIFKTITDAFV